MRRTALSIMAVAVLGLALPVPAIAAKAERFSEAQTSLYCDNLVNEAGAAYAFVGAREQQGAWATLNFWAAPGIPGEDPPTWTAFSEAVTVSADGTALQAAFLVYENGELGGDTEPTEPAVAVESASPMPTPSPSPAPTPEPSATPGPTSSPAPEPSGEPGGERDPVLVGEAILSASLATSGTPVSYAFYDRFGNHVYRGESTSQELSVAGTLALPQGITFSLAGCTAFRETFAAFSNAPAVSTNRTTSRHLVCAWQTEDGFVALSATDDEYGTYADVYVEDASGSYTGWNGANLTRSDFSTTVSLFPAKEDGELEAVGTASASAALTSGGRISESFILDGTRISVKGELLLVSGVLDLVTPEGSRSLEMTESSCSAADVSITEVPSGSTHGGRIGNDTPSQAVTLSVGSQETVDTSGAAADPERPCTVDDPESGETYEIPFGRTAWWTFAGTGGSVTVDTAGSDFDTVVGVYRLDGSDLTQVACVDDVLDPEFTLLARATVATSADSTYYLQAGGFGGESGQLVVALTEP